MSSRQPFSPYRRRLLIASVAGTVALGAAGALPLSRSEYARARWVEEVLRRNLPGVRIDEASLSVFVRDVLAGNHFRARKRGLSVVAQQYVPWLTMRVPKIRTGLEKLERQVLTEYLLGSNFFRVSEPRRETITYYGPAVACANPFRAMDGQATSA